MADNSLIQKVQNLSDIELAVLICLVNQEHCIIKTVPVSIDDLVRELQLVLTRDFGLKHAVLDCNRHTTLDVFNSIILPLENSRSRSKSPVQTRHDVYFLGTPTRTTAIRSPEGNGTMVNVIIAKNLNQAPRQIQMQALELMKTKRLYVQAELYTAPKRFLVIAALAGVEDLSLMKHLNDYMFISHFHHFKDGFPNLEESYDDDGSNSSVIIKGLDLKGHEDPVEPAISSQRLTNLTNMTTFSMEVKQYQMNIISFLRLHRAVGGGITATATKYFDKLNRCLAPLHNLTYVTPSLVALAAKKIYTHRIQIVKPENERSMQWGSELEAVSELLEGVGPEEVLDDVLGELGAEVPI
ncbi:Bgt-2325 [Blumeria graminis f. sp. tritici]|uniref:Bgt-2325 n=2 Tax=Blumeria graminis f. sp. tritici TaxID=62690 RepID=A0A9X9MP28_BLUGR|nr:Bgt-2325 [Blumeria graminis f. sp. tritici]